jgi:hypothetical protein
MWSKVEHELRYFLNDPVGFAEESASFVAAHDPEQVAFENAIRRRKKAMAPVSSATGFLRNKP